jgi:hypothetical protein
VGGKIIRLIIPPNTAIKKAQYFGLGLDSGILLAIQTDEKSGIFNLVTLGINILKDSS